MKKRIRFFKFLLLFLTPHTSLLTPSLWAAPNFTQDSDIRLSSATVQTILPNGSDLRMYFIRDNIQVRTATAAAAGLVWFEETGVKISTGFAPALDASSITACAILAIASGGFRMIYSAQSSTDSFHVLSATSTDGLAWMKESGVRFQSSTATVFVGHTRLTKTSNSQWRLYYLEDSNVGNDQKDYELRSAISTDEGKTFSDEGKKISAAVGPIAISTLTENRIRLLSLAPLTNQTTYSQVLSYLSANGLSFSQESGARISSDSSKGGYQSLFAYKINDFRWRLYYSYIAQGSTTPHVYSALTQTPSIDSISPSAMLRTQSSVDITIKGEIFSSNPTARLSLTGSTDINATNLTRSDDQTITARFNPLNQTLGKWALVVTNSDAQSATLDNAVTIDFPEGEIQFTDNLFKPQEGGRARMDVTIYDAGPLTLRVFTINGAPVRTLIDETRAIGQHAIFWDGRNDEGSRVASGLYYLHVKGPKIKKIEKIIVIK